MITTRTAINTIQRILEEFYTEILGEKYRKRYRNEYQLNEIQFLDDYVELLYIAKMEPNLPKETDGLQASLRILHRIISSFQPMFYNTFPASYNFNQMSALQAIMHEKMKEQIKEYEKENA